MAIQTLKLYHATPATIVASGAAIAGGARSAESSAVSSAQHGDYPLGNYELTFTVLSAMAIGESIDLFARLYAKDGVTQTPAPSGTPGQTSAFEGLLIGSFKVSTDLSQTLVLHEKVVPKMATFYINDRSTIQIEAGWSLSVDLLGYGN